MIAVSIRPDVGVEISDGKFPVLHQAGGGIVECIDLHERELHHLTEAPGLLQVFSQLLETRASLLLGSLELSLHLICILDYLL